MSNTGNIKQEKGSKDKVKALKLYPQYINVQEELRWKKQLNS